MELNNYIALLEKNNIPFNCMIEEYDDIEGNITGQFYLRNDL